jgi:hypothetical protein
MRYTMTAPDLMSRTVQLNGKDLMLSESGDVPALSGVAAPKGEVPLPTASVTFLTFAAAGNPACK